MSKEEKFLVGVLLAAVVAFAVAYLVCRSRKGWYLEPGQPDECIPSAIRSAVKAGIYNVFKVPQAAQFVIDYALQNQPYVPAREPEMYDDVTGEAYYHRLPEETSNWSDYWMR